MGLMHSVAFVADFLSCIGSDGVLKVKETPKGKDKAKVTREELFKIQDSEPQFTMRNISRGAKGQVSNRNGDEVKADQSDIQDTERFQFEVVDGVVSLGAGATGAWTGPCVLPSGRLTSARFRCTF
jgi:hypothetical protein